MAFIRQGAALCRNPMRASEAAFPNFPVSISKDHSPAKPVNQTVGMEKALSGGAGGPCFTDDKFQENVLAPPNTADTDRHGFGTNQAGGHRLQRACLLQDAHVPPCVDH